MLKNLLNEWEGFEKNVVPRNAPSVQRQEMRRAFYAGASAMFGLITNLDVENLGEKESAKVLDNLQSELQRFFSQVGKKY
jgi:hypothetical protein